MNPKGLTKNDEKVINEIIDQLLEDYTKNNKIIFKNESDRAKHHFNILNQRLKYWKKSKTCMIPECKKRSIKKSHTIPKGMSLNQISEAGHLLTPLFDHHIGEIILEKIGVSQASIFPGFCAEHEQLFKEFETQKLIENEAHICLQTYRSACRELFRTKYVIDYYNDLKINYCKLRDERLKEIIEEKVFNKELSSEVLFNNLIMKNDPLIEKSDRQILHINKLYLHLKNKIIPGLEKAVFNNDESGIFIEAIDINYMYPVAISGCAAFYIKDNNLEKSIDIIMTVLPSEGKSLIIFSGDVVDRKYIKHYIAKWNHNVFSLISLIETWMVNGTDQWYITPSIWEEIKLPRQKDILRDIAECKQNIGEEYQYSIFDTIRKYMLAMLKEKEEPTQDEEYWNFVKSQEDKMV